ncbi:hypothetical protein Tco_1308164 [Tanacetum coccineum]
MASQDDRLSKFEADFKQQQSEMTNKIDTVLKAITDRIAGALPNDMVKNPKLNVNSNSSVLFDHSYPIEYPNAQPKFTVQSIPSESIKVTPETTSQKRRSKKRRTTQKT